MAWSEGRWCTDGAIGAAVEEQAGEAKHVVVVDLLLRDAEVVKHGECSYGTGLAVELVVWVHAGGSRQTDVSGSVQWYEVRTRLGQSMCSQRLGVKQI